MIKQTENRFVLLNINAFMNSLLLKTKASFIIWYFTNRDKCKDLGIIVIQFLQTGIIKLSNILTCYSFICYENFGVLKAAKNIIKKSLVLSLLVIYLLITLVDIFYLHSHNSSPLQLPAISVLSQAHNSSGDSSSAIELHRIFKTVITSKNGSRLCITLATILFFLGLSKLAYDRFSAREKRYARSSLYFHPSIFLNLCALRI
jgi:hypothetical protein